MASLILDVGNTSVKIVEWESSVSSPEIVDGQLIPGSGNVKPKELGSIATELHSSDPAKFHTNLVELGGQWNGPVLMVSVIPDVDELVKKIWPDLKQVGLHTELPFPHEIQNPQTVGPDRFCNIAWAVAAGLSSALVVDVGTATTFDLLLDGVFKGGLIAPGMAFSAREMGRKGAMLFETPFEQRPAVVGLDSREAMIGGAWLTGCGGVEWTLARLLETYGELPVVLTGGLCEKLSAEGRYVDPYWTLRGAAFLGGEGPRP